jgi:hypothetical protein
MVTDPPFGVMYDPEWRNRTGASETKRMGKVMNDDRAYWREAWALCPGEAAYVSGTGRCMRPRWPRAWRPAGSTFAARSSEPTNGLS